MRKTGLQPFHQLINRARLIACRRKFGVQVKQARVFVKDGAWHRVEVSQNCASNSPGFSTSNCDDLSPKPL
jgi:hypothetical protein